MHRRLRSSTNIEQLSCSPDECQQGNTRVLRCRKPTNNISPCTYDSVDDKTKINAIKETKTKKCNAENEQLHYPNKSKNKQPSVDYGSNRIIARDSEILTIKKFIAECISSDEAGFLYISGPPGTGKTYVVQNILKEVQVENAYCNLMSVKATILEEITKLFHLKNVTDIGLFANYIMKSKRHLLLVIDEIDQLLLSNENVLYQLIELALMKRSRLILIGIANTLDFTDKVLAHLSADSKSKFSSLNFASYSREEIFAIINERQKEFTADRGISIDEKAVLWCASKVASSTGDIRMASEICRLAVEKAEVDKLKVVSILDIIEITTRQTNALSSRMDLLPLLQKLAFISAYASKGSDDVKLYSRFMKVCCKLNVSCISQSEFLSVLQSLEDHGLISLEKKKMGGFLVNVQINEEDLLSLIENVPFLNSIFRAAIN